jgi:hypothetical protein
VPDAFLQYLDLIICRLEVMQCTFLDFNGDIGVVHEILGQPDSAEMAPSELMLNNVSVYQDLANKYWVVAALLVVLNTLIF